MARAAPRSGWYDASRQYRLRRNGSGGIGLGVAGYSLPSRRELADQERVGGGLCPVCFSAANAASMYEPVQARARPSPAVPRRAATGERATRAGSARSENRPVADSRGSAVPRRSPPAQRRCRCSAVRPPPRTRRSRAATGGTDCAVVALGAAGHRPQRPRCCEVEVDRRCARPASATTRVIRRPRGRRRRPRDRSRRSRPAGCTSRRGRERRPQHRDAQAIDAETASVSSVSTTVDAGA